MLGYTIVYAILFLLLFLIPKAIQAQIFPSGFSQVQVATIYYPTSLAFAPDGRIFATEKAGVVKIIKNGSALPTPFLKVAVDQNGERGLSSIAIDPDFNNNHFVYIYYTTTSGTIHNRLSRFTANGDVSVPGSELVILDFEPSVNSIHNSGGMAFSSDGKLYLAVGNDNVNTNSQDLTNYKGKILRINTDGSVPAGNPFTGSESAKRIWAYGLRNPWTISTQPGTNRLFVDDVGEATWEEINDATVGGKNFGWSLAEGNSTNPAFTNPLYTYHHGPTGTDSGCAITGGTFFNPPLTNYPSQYTGNYFFIDYCNHWINYLDFSSGVQKHNFATALPFACNYLKVGNDGNLYYFAIGQNALYKIIYSNNNAPAFTSQPVNRTISQGQNVTFSVTVSGATPLSYQWKKNGTNISGANMASYTINNVQPLDAAFYNVVVSNTYGFATSNSASLTVTPFNAAPVATIISPPSGTFYRNGDVINFSGNGSDLEDGTLPASSFNWFTEFHHYAHIHPGPSIPPAVKSGSFSTTFGETSANVFFRLLLVVTDSKGLTDTSFVDIKPITSTLNLASQPSGLQLLLDQQPHTTPFSILAVSGMPRSISAVSPQSLNGVNYIFDYWLQGGAITQTINVTDNDATYTAVYKQAPASICSASGTILREVWNNVAGTTVSSIPTSSTPTFTNLFTIFEEPSNLADNFGSRMTGYLCPPASGNYTFWIASDDNSELWLSTNDSPVNKRKIAYVIGYTNSREWTKYTSQQSAPIFLTAGTKYYIESLHKEGTFGDNLAVGWQLPNGTLERPIPGPRLSPFTSSGTTAPFVTITSPANGSAYSTPANITINANATSSSGTISKVEFFQGTTKIGEDLTAPYSFTWMNVTTGSYALKAVATDNTNATATSQTINVTVASCSTPIITPSGPTTICSGTVILNANTAPGNIYQWKKDGVNITGATNSSYAATVSGSYQIKVIQGSCISWSAPTTVKIQYGLSASITPGGPTSFCSGGHVVLYANTCSGYIYQWIKDGTPIAGATAASYTATIAGNYQLRITQNSLNAWSSLVSVQLLACKIPDALAQEPSTIQAPFEIPNSSNDFQMKVFPNPTSGLFTIMINMHTSEFESITMRIVNVLGEEIYKKQILSNGENFKEVVELDKSLPAGIYTLHVIIGNKEENTIMIMEK